MKTGDKVCFRASVVKRSGHDKRVADMRGTVLEIIAHGRVARVDCDGTYDNENGGTVRGIPVANLSVIRNGVLPISATEPD